MKAQPVQPTVAEIDASLEAARKKLAAAQTALAAARAHYVDELAGTTNDEFASAKFRKKVAEADDALQQACDRVAALEAKRERAVEAARATEMADRFEKLKTLVKRFENDAGVLGEKIRAVAEWSDALIALGQEILQAVPYPLPDSERLSIMYARSVLVARLKVALYAESNGLFERGAIPQMPGEVLASGQTLKVHARAAGQQVLSFQDQAVARSNEAAR